MIQRCPANTRLDHDLCICLPNNGWEDPSDQGCQANPNGCRDGYRWDTALCQCVNCNTVPTGGCPVGLYWDFSVCQCQELEPESGSTDPDGPFGGMDEFCTSPPVPCLVEEYWDRDLCECRPLGRTSSAFVRCTPPSPGCRRGYQWDINLCRCEPIRPTETPQSSCTAPVRGCPIAQQWEPRLCRCVRPGAVVPVCIGPASGCPTGQYWDLNECRCRGGEPCAPIPCPTTRRMYFDTEFCHCRPFSYFRK